MKRPVSFLACLIIVVSLLHFRVQNSDIKSPYPLKVTTWDALGYYLYLPSIFIYHDVKKMDWFDEINSEYQLSGGKVYQFNETDNGNQVFKYLGGIALIEAPYFFIGHAIAKRSNYAADGFSAPYQYAISFGVLLFFLFSVFLLRNVLLRYFSDQATAITLLLTILATNAINYSAVEPAMSHGSIFPLYVLVLYTTIKWHEKPAVRWALFTGLIIGLATICRPTEAIMFLIPLLWNTHTKEAAKNKWALVRSHRFHMYMAFLFGFIGILPQLIYWKYVTGSFIYDVGSGWDFLTPHVRVLTGWNKGWFIYTPVTIFFMVGMFFIKKYPFRKAVLFFCLLNIYIIISWRDWRYGGSYSTRALMQSLPVFALALGGFIEHIDRTRWRFAIYLLGAYLIFVNFFQIPQYYDNVLHYYDMNRKYYSRIYLNDSPSPLDVSLMDTDEWIRNEKEYEQQVLYEEDSVLMISLAAGSYKNLMELPQLKLRSDKKRNVLKIETTLFLSEGIQGGSIICQLDCGDLTKKKTFRMANPISPQGYVNDYAFYLHVPEQYDEYSLILYIYAETQMEGSCQKTKISSLVK